MKTYLLGGAIYFVMCFPLSRLVVRYESALKAGTNRKRHRRHVEAQLLQIGVAA